MGIYKTKDTVVGQTDAGQLKDISVTSEGHIEVALHAPRLPFGSIHTESLRPIFQTDATYGINTNQVTTTTTLSGSATASDSYFIIATGVTNGATAAIQSRKRLRYRPGQGVVGRFAGLYTSPVASSYQVIGFGHAEDGVYFGYQGTTFGILYVNRGVREVQTLTISVASSHTENVVVTLNGTAFNIAVTNSGNIQRTVWEISQGTYTGWKAYPSGATIVFVADSVGNKAGAFTLAGSSATGTFAETKAGVASTDSFIAQSTWNVDKLDGTGASGVTLDPTKGNVYEIQIQYLGHGAISFNIEVCTSNQNNPTFVTVHTMKLPNTLTASSFRNPSFPFTMAAYSAGSTTNLSVKCSSFAGFIEGEKMMHGGRFSYFNSSTGVGSGSYLPLFTILNARYFGGISNQSVINIISASGALKHTSPCVFYLIKNGELTGNPNFASFATDSCSLWDTAATAVTITSNSQIMWSGHLGDTGEFDHSFNGGSHEELTIQPGEWITLAARSVTGTPSYVTGSINTREDQ